VNVYVVGKCPSTKLPGLSTSVACIFFAIPASQNKTERSFSAAIVISSLVCEMHGTLNTVNTWTISCRSWLLRSYYKQNNAFQSSNDGDDDKDCSDMDDRIITDTLTTVGLSLHTLTWSLTWPWFNPHPNGCIGPHFDVILICFELPPLLPPRWFPSLTNPCWLCSSSLHVNDLDLSWIPEPPSATPVEVCAGEYTNCHCLICLLWLR